MAGKVRFHERGSAVIMAVGLLVMLAMLGSTFIILTYLDRKEARSLATAAPMKGVALGVLEQIAAERVIDLHMGPNGPYGPGTSPDQAIDHPGEAADPILASSHPLVVAGWPRWAHLSNPGGNLDDVVRLVLLDGRISIGPLIGQSIDQVDIDGDGNPDLDWVDTDGFGYNADLGFGMRFYDGDAILHDSGVRDRLGRRFYVAVRVVDASALINANLHYSPAPAKVGQPMPITDVSLEELLTGITGNRLTAQAIRDNVHRARARLGWTPTVHPIELYWRNYALSPLYHGNVLNPPPPVLNPPYYPFDISDLLGVSWGGPSPSAASGRLHDALTDAVHLPARSFMTTHSASRCLVPAARTEVDQRAKADLNTADYEELYKASYNLLACVTDSAARKKAAAQLAVNIIDYRDREPTGPEIPTAQLAAGTTVCGLERQPFIVKAGYKIELVNPGPPPQKEWYFGIELYNPYAQDINITGWKLQTGTGKPEALAATSIPADGRLVLVSRAGIPAAGGAASETHPLLNLREEVRILRPARLPSGAAVDAVVGIIRPGDFNDDPNNVNVVDPAIPATECLLRCDDRTAALYSLAIYKHTRDDITQSPAILGQGGLVPPDDPQLSETMQPPFVRPQACPVYVRDGPFTNVGELNRIFWVGPTVAEPLDVQLVTTAGCDPYDRAAANGRLSLYGGIPAPQAGTPAVPPGCTAPDFFMVHSPLTDGWDNDGDTRTDEADEVILYGLININTAPEEVLACLPGLAGLPTAARTAIVTNILHYRDKLGAYAANRQSLGIASLREEPGFASPGEIAIPIWAEGSQSGVLPQNEYSLTNEQPFNYTVAETDANGNTVTAHDDGLSTATVPTVQSVQNDLVKRHVYYSWLSNHITVRSDVYVAYIRVDLRVAVGDAPLAVRKYVAVIDRSNCRTPGDRPHVLMFAEIR